MRTLFIKSFLLAFGYAVGFYLLQFFLSRAGMLPKMPDAANLITWDAAYYSDIAANGYGPGQMRNGFFYLFPLLWKLVGGGTWAIIFLNVTFFATGFGLLQLFKPQPLRTQLLWLSTPAIYFSFVPYSEAVFFLLSSVSLYGIVNNKKWLVFVALLLLSLSRATVIVLVPAVLFMQLVSHERKDWFKESLYALKWLITPMILGFALFIYDQYLTTGIWFAYFKVQSINFFHVFNWPQFPLSDYDAAPQNHLWINALGLFVGLFGFVKCIIILFGWLFKNKTLNDPLGALALAYVALIMIIVLFFDPAYDGHTFCIASNRYIFGTPFFFIILSSELKKIKLTAWWNWVLLIALANGCWFLFGSYVHLQQVLFYNIDTVLIVAYLKYAKDDRPALGYVLFGFNLLIQMICFQQFISPAYPD